MVHLNNDLCKVQIELLGSVSLSDQSPRSKMIEGFLSETLPSLYRDIFIVIQILNKSSPNITTKLSEDRDPYICCWLLLMIHIISKLVRSSIDANH